MQYLSLSDAKQLIENVFEVAREKSLRPLSVAVLDHCGELKSLQRQDGASIISTTIAIGKAQCAMYWKKPGREVEAFAQARPAFYQSVVAAVAKPMVAAAGGELIRNTQDEIIGAIGISGDSSDNDEICALGGLSVSGFGA